MIDPDIKKILMSLEGKTIEQVSFLYNDKWNELDYIHIQTTDKTWYSIRALAEDDGVAVSTISERVLKARIKDYNTKD